MTSRQCKGHTNRGRKCGNQAQIRYKGYCCLAHLERATKKPKVERCSGTTKEGKRCRLRVAKVGDFCKHHSWQVGSPNEAVEEYSKVSFFAAHLVLDSEYDGPKRKMEYDQYLRTDHWNRVKAIVRKIYDDRCQICSKNTKLHVHHNNYENLWYETVADVVLLCAKCHAVFHEKNNDEPIKLSVKIPDDWKKNEDFLQGHITAIEMMQHKLGVAHGNYKKYLKDK